MRVASGWRGGGGAGVCHRPGVLVPHRVPDGAHGRSPLGVLGGSGSTGDPPCPGHGPFPARPQRHQWHRLTLQH